MKNSLFLIFLIFLALVLGGFFVAVILGGVVMLLPISQIPALKLTQLLSTISIFLLPPLVAAKIFSANMREFLMIKKVGWRSILLSVAFILVALPSVDMFLQINESLPLPSFLSGLEEWARQQEANMAGVTKLLLSGTTVWDLVVNLVVVALAAAVAEEVFFRGFLQGALLRRINPHLAIWIVAVIFSAIHFQPFGFIPRMLLGAAFGYLAYFSGSILPSILAHFINNGISVCLYFIFQTEEVMLFGEDVLLYLSGVVSLVLAIATLWLFKRVAPK